MNPVQLVYDPLYWGAVFPLGMYPVATYHVARLTKLTLLLVIPRYSLYLALAAWISTAIAMAVHTLRAKAPRVSDQGNKYRYAVRAEEPMASVQQGDLLPRLTYQNRSGVWIMNPIGKVAGIPS